MMIDGELITYLEDLACLTLSDEEKQRLTGDLENILTGMNKLNEADTADIPERSHPFDNVNAFREDAVESSFDRELILKNAPKRNEETIIAPRTVE